MVATMPPGPRSWALQGQLADFRKDRLEFFTRQARQWGDMVAVRFAHRRIFLVSHPDLIEEILVAKSRHFIKHFALRLNPLLLGRGLLTSEGDFWLRQRRLIQPVFLKQRIASYAPFMVEATERMLTTWVPDQTRDIYQEMMGLTLEIAAKTLFDTEAGGEAAVVSEAMHQLQENFLLRFTSMLPLPLWIPTPNNIRVRRAVRRLDAILYKFIQERRSSGVKKGDLLSLLLEARDEEGQGHMTDQEVRDEAMTLFLAGHETTALALSWTWYLLASHPAAQERLVQEVREVVGERLPTVEDWPRLRYIEKVVLEGMRLYPPAYVIGREARTPCTIGRYNVPVGTTLLMSQWVVHRDPRWYERPDEFRPERWNEDQARHLPKFAYFPFGGGPRLCIGNTFAMMEMVLILATLAQKYRFTLVPDHPVEPWPTFTLRPAKGILAPLVRR